MLLLCFIGVSLITYIYISKMNIGENNPMSKEVLEKLEKKAIEKIVKTVIKECVKNWSKK